MTTYIVKKGDTIEGIATRQYGIGSESGRILSANASVDDTLNLKAGTLLTIPDINNSSSKNNPANISFDSINEVALLIDEKKFTCWTDVTITRSMDTIGDRFELKAPWTPKNLDYRKIFKPFGYQNIVIYVGGEKLITGTVVNLSPTANSKRQDLIISGYSKAGILNDVTMPLSAWPLEFSNLDLKQIAETLVVPFGLSVKFLAPQGAQFKKVTLTPDRKIYPFLIDLAKQRGLVMSSDVDGNLIFQKTTTEPATSSIIEGFEPYVSSNAIFNGQNRFSSFAALGDGWEKGAGESAVLDDDSIRKSGIVRPMIYKANDISSGDLQNDAKAKLGRSLATSIDITVTVKDWRDKNGNLWRDNTKIIFQAPGNMLYTQSEYVIREIEYIKGPNAITANLKLVFPEAYSGEIRSEFPWD